MPIIVDPTQQLLDQQPDIASATHDLQGETPSTEEGLEAQRTSQSTSDDLKNYTALEDFHNRNNPDYWAEKRAMGRETGGYGYDAQPPQFSEPLSAEEINKRYAPIGFDGKPVSITDEPLPDEIGAKLGKMKQDRLNAEDTWARYSRAHSGVTNFGVGMGGFLLDPVNAGSLFVPGIGEEMALTAATRVGLEGVAARSAARVVAGASAGAAAQAPLTAVKYGLDPLASQDFDWRSALTDVAYAAVGNAAIHAGAFGSARELGVLKEDQLMKSMREPTIAEMYPLMQSNALMRHTALSSSIAQLIDGRPIDMTDIFPEMKLPNDFVDYHTMKTDQLKGDIAEALKPQEPQPYNIFTPEGKQVSGETKLSEVNPEANPESSVKTYNLEDAANYVRGEAGNAGKDLSQLREDLKKAGVKEGESADDAYEKLLARNKQILDEAHNPQAVDLQNIAQKQQNLSREGYVLNATGEEVERARQDLFNEEENPHQTTHEIKFKSDIDSGAKLAEMHEGEAATASEPSQTADLIEHETLQSAKRQLPKEIYDQIINGKAATDAESAAEHTKPSETTERSGGANEGAGEPAAVNAGGVKPEAEGRTESGSTSGSSQPKPTELDQEIDRLNSQIDPTKLSLEERQAVLEAQKLVQKADKYRQGYEAAANCLSEEGI